jgi:antitoxin VapB
LEAEYRRVAAEKSLAERLGAIADELAALAGPGGRDMTKDEIDAMWGNP